MTVSHSSPSNKLPSLTLDDILSKLRFLNFLSNLIESSSLNLKLLDLEGDYVKTARRVGICLGD